MTRTLSLCGAALAAWTVAAATSPKPAVPDTNNSPIVVADYMRAVPYTSTPARRCRRVCVKSEGGTATHEGHCVQWQTVC